MCSQCFGAKSSCIVSLVAKYCYIARSQCMMCYDSFGVVLCVLFGCC